MKKIYCLIIVISLLLCNLKTYKCEASTKLNLHSKSYALIDGDSGRLLVGNNEKAVMPMASTTKIMTLILALESGKWDEIVKVTSNSTKQPRVKLGFSDNQSFYFKDLLYSMILESHNDSAYLVGEFVAGSSDEFLKLMNNKAKQIGLNQTTFLTINGLDKSENNTAHSTTSYELALLMKYCIKDSPKSKEFIKICQTKEYSFFDVDGIKEYKVYNKNNLLNHYSKMLSGKTGFTSGAGYCYVGAIEADEKTYIVALLGCGWPPNKNYKWEDAIRLFDYGINNYKKITPFLDIDEKKIIKCMNGESEYVDIDINKNFEILVENDMPVTLHISGDGIVYAPLDKETALCKISIKVGNSTVYEITLYSKYDIKEKEIKFYKHFDTLVI